MNTSGHASREASFWAREGEKVRCNLCPHACAIADGKRGLCGVRENRKGTLHTLIFGKASSIHPDPIEKKPLFHFLPGTTAISFGSIGCNLSCMHCQNWSISRARYGQIELMDITTDDVVNRAREAGARSVSWTYNEPIIWHEFTTAASKAAHKAGLKTNYVTNGYINEAPLRELKGVIDAMNIDVKGFTEGFYKRLCGGSLAPVLRACEVAQEIGIHIELTYLVIPEHNDAEREITEFCKWVAGALGKDVPVHFSAFHPDHRLTGVPSTPEKTLVGAYDLARKEGLEFVYLGNIRAGDRDDTYCPSCGIKVIDREGFWVREMNLSGNRCRSCGTALRLVV